MATLEWVEVVLDRTAPGTAAWNCLGRVLLVVWALPNPAIVSRAHISLAVDWNL